MRRNLITNVINVRRNLYVRYVCRLIRNNDHLKSGIFLENFYDMSDYRWLSIHLSWAILFQAFLTPNMDSQISGLLNRYKRLKSSSIYRR